MNQTTPLGSIKTKFAKEKERKKIRAVSLLIASLSFLQSSSASFNLSLFHLPVG